MAVTAVTLVDGSETYALLPNDDITLNSLEKSFPEVRVVSEPIPGASGTYDATELYGPAAVSLEMELFNTPSELVRRISRFMLPRRRPYLVVTDSEWATTRRVLLRTDQHSAPVTGGADAIHREVQASWVVPSGVWEDNDETTVTILADTGVNAGKAFPIVFAFAWPAGSQAGSSSITSISSADVYPILRMYGPCTGPRATLESTGQTLSFNSSLTLGAGEYLEVDVAARTALLNGTVSRLSNLDFSVSSWWALRASETNSVRYHPASGVSAGCVLEVRYRNAWTI